MDGWICVRSQREKKMDYNSWMHDPDLMNAIKTWVWIQGDSKFLCNQNHRSCF